MMKSVLNRSVWSQSNFSYSQSIGAWYCGRVFVVYRFLSGFKIFFQKTDFILKESVLLETRLLGEVFSRLSKIFIALLRSKQFFVCHQCHFEYLAFLFFLKMPMSPKIFGIFIFFLNAKIALLFWHDIFILKCHAIIFWMAYININIWH